MAQMIPLFFAEDEENTSSMEPQRVFRDLNDPVDCYDDLELVRRSASPELQFHRAFLCCSPHLQVCVARRIFASRTFQITCGDGINVSQASASRYIRDVSLGLQAICQQFVSMPVGEKIFYEIAHFPGDVGLVDGTHIRIQRPSHIRR